MSGLKITPGLHILWGRSTGGGRFFAFTTTSVAATAATAAATAATAAAAAAAAIIGTDRRQPIEITKCRSPFRLFSSLHQDPDTAAILVCLQPTPRHRPHQALRTPVEVVPVGLPPLRLGKHDLVPSEPGVV